MINIFINNRVLQIPCCWEELELDKALALRSYLSCVDGFAQVAHCEANANEFFVEAMARGELKCEDLVEIIAGLGQGDCEDFDAKWLWDNVLKVFVWGLLFESDYSLKYLKNFEFKGLDYYLPKVGCLRQFIENKHISAEKFCALNNLYAENALENAALMCAFLVSEDDDLYELAQEFGALSMDVVFEIFYIISCFNIYLNDLYPECYKALGVGRAKMSSFRGWHELIYFVAGDVPSEIECAKRMDCLDFMRLLDYKLKKIRL
ncbi:MAG: hypothetical protein R3Y38_05800 [Rikenellaceae bacterium]